MAAKVSIVKKYAEADSSGKVDIICKYYPTFLGMIDGFTDGLLYVIENEKIYNRKSAHGDLGIRIQSSGKYSDITGDTAVNHVITIDAIRACDFSEGILEGVELKEKIQKEAVTLREMRRHYTLFNHQISTLPPNEGEFLKCYLKKKQNLLELADERGIQYESVCQKIRRAKKKLKIQMIGFMDGTL